MKNDRIGEYLWHEWDGSLLKNVGSNSIVYYTEGHIDVSNAVVKRALASAAQRDGIFDSLGEAMVSAEQAKVYYLWAGFEDASDESLSVCDEFGETFYGDILENVLEFTFVEL